MYSRYTQNILPFNLCRNNWSTLIFMPQENAPSWQSVQWMGKRTYVSLIHMAIVTTMYWYHFWYLLLYFDTFGDVSMPCMVKCQRQTNLLLNVRNCKWVLLPSIHHMRNMRDYFLTIFCTYFKNIFNNISVNINFDFDHSCISAAILKSHSFFVPLVYIYYSQAYA